MKTFWLGAAAATALAAAAASAQQAAPPAPSVQQQFDAASAASEAGRFAEALTILEALEQRLAGARQPRSLAIVRVRKGEALLRLGRVAEAETALRASLPLLPAGDASLNEDRFLGYAALARAAELRLDYRAAAAQYRIAAAIEVEPRGRLAIYRGLIQTQMFHDAPAALAASDEAIRLAATVAPGDGEVEGPARMLRGRVLLNMGRFPEARAELERATRHLGGLGTRVNLRDIVARSDLAIAALLAGDADAARRFLALTGAGRMEEAALPPSGRTPPPRCGDGLSPADVAVVEIAIRDDGTVAAATPVYASVQGDAAVRFARAALAWTWYPERVQPIEPLFRSAVRVELRCTNAVRLTGELPPREIEETARWSAARGIAIELDPARNIALPRLRTDLAAAEARHGAASPHLLAPLMRVARHEDTPPRERVQLLRRALPIARAAQAPSPYLAMIAIAIAEARHEAAGGHWQAPADYRALLEEPGLAADTYVAARLHLAHAEDLYIADRDSDAAAALARVEALPGFGADHPLRAEFLQWRVATEMARGNADAAAAAWRALPAGTSGCTASPRHERGSGSNEDFPSNALNWGFAGWAMVEAQVGPEGRPEPVRTVVAYPPFVFGGATERMVSRFRFAPGYAADGRACATTQRRVIYRLPE